MRRGVDYDTWLERGAGGPNDPPGCDCRRLRCGYCTEELGLAECDGCSELIYEDEQHKCGGCGAKLCEKCIAKGNTEFCEECMELCEQ